MCIRDSFDVDQTHALSRPPDRPNVARRHSQNLALLSDHHQLVVVVYLGHADDLTVAIAGLDVDDADATPRLHTVLIEPGALAVPLFGHREARAARFPHLHGHALVVFPYLNPVNAAGS